MKEKNRKWNNSQMKDLRFSSTVSLDAVVHIFLHSTRWRVCRMLVCILNHICVWCDFHKSAFIEF